MTYAIKYALVVREYLSRNPQKNFDNDQLMLISYTLQEFAATQLHGRIADKKNRLDNQK